MQFNHQIPPSCYCEFEVGAVLDGAKGNAHSHITYTCKAFKWDVELTFIFIFSVHFDDTYFDSPLYMQLCMSTNSHWSIRLSA